MTAERSKQTYQSLAAKLSGELSQPLFEHSTAVADQAQKLAEIHRPDAVERVRLAGLLHDNAKEWSVDEMTEYLEEIDREDELAATEHNPQLYHAVVGRFRAEREFGVGDPEVLEAIRYHTTGCRGLSQVGRILYAADKTSEDRDYDDVELLRDYAETQLGLACYEITRRTLEQLLGRESTIATDSVEFYNELLREQREWAKGTNS